LRSGAGFAVDLGRSALGDEKQVLEWLWADQQHWESRKQVLEWVAATD
jgi:hypothetical protein